MAEDSVEKREKEFSQAFAMDYTGDREGAPSQDYYEGIKSRFAEERDLRLGYRPPGTEIYQALEGDLERFEHDPREAVVTPRKPIEDEVEVLFIGGGFSALLTSARLKQKGVESVRIVERGSDVGGTWYWNRYPGVACDVVSYDYLPLLDETGYIPTRHYAGGEEIWAYCKMIAERFELYDLAVFQTTVTSTVWDEDDQLWHVGTNRGDRMKARFVICANGTLAKPRLARIDGIADFAGHSFHTSRWDYEYTGDDLEQLADKRVAIIGTGATAVQAIPELGKHAKQLTVFQRTPSSIDIRDDWPTDPEWAATLEPGWQAARREKAIAGPLLSADQKAKRASMSREEKIRRQENANIDYMMRIHKRIEADVEDPETAESLKPWYMFMCKRPCFHNEYLPTFNRPNVRLVDTKGKGVTRITERGPEFDGEVFDVDLIIFATGFEVQQTGIYNRIVGRDGLDLEDKYADGIRTVLGIHSRGYPNFFVMGGYQAFFAFNLTDVLNCQGEHIAECIDHLRRNDLHSLEPTDEIEEWWVQEVIANRGKTNRNKECTPGYYNFEGAENRRQDGNYNGTMRQYLDFMKNVREGIETNFELSPKRR
ncbi:MAG: monooxygenase [Deltaproteobacteria bacterium]|nr:monooxygenase [Deltaproteobacteria bacterium]